MANGSVNVPGASSADLKKHTGNTSNPHSVTKKQIGLGDVDNTSDTNKPVSTAQATAIADAKAAGTSAQTNLNSHTSNTSNPHKVTASQVGADPSGTASSAVAAHNTNTSAHDDIRDLISSLTTRLNSLADSDDTTLDQLSEIVAYIKSNKSLIEAITTNKISVDAIVNNLTTNSTNKVLSAAQGVAIKALIDEVASNVSQLSSEMDANKWNLLWENANPTSEFAAQALTISDLGNYNKFKVLIKYSIDSDSYSEYEVTVPAGSSRTLRIDYGYMSGETKNLCMTTRDVTFDLSAGTVDFGKTWYGYQGTANYYGSRCVPIAIYGTTI